MQQRTKRILFVLAIIAVSPSALARQMVSPASELPSINVVALGERYENGESVKRNYRQAIIMYCQAAARGDRQAYFNLGWMFLNGRGVPRDEATAVMWLHKAAERGVPQAANLLRLLAGVTPSPSRPCTPPPSAAIASIAGRPGVMPQPPAAVREVVDDAARQVGIDPHLLLSVISVESGFNPNAISPKSAAGLMQLMPETAARLGVRDRFDPRENVLGGAKYLRSLLQTFSGNLTLALAAYNAGEKTVVSRGGVPPFRETIDYIAAVKGLCVCGE